MNYRLDLHIHTEASPDSRTGLAQAAAAAKKRGIHALAVCDHNRCAPQELFDNPMVEGVLLLPSVEYSTECGHLLGLCLQKPCRAEGEQSGRVLFAAAAAAIHAAGGLCVLAHPYELTQRTVAQTDAQIAVLAPLLDAVESDNCRATKKRKNANKLARQAAERHNLRRTAGSDAHTPAEIGRAYLTLELPSLTVAAVREALQTQTSSETVCGRCRHLALAKSRFYSLQTAHASPAAYLQWTAYCGICIIRTVKGWFL